MLSFGKKWDTGGEGIIIGDKLAGNCFLLRDFSSNELFQIIYDCEVENVHYTQKFGKFIRKKKLLETSFFQICGLLCDQE